MRGEERRRQTGAHPLGRVASWGAPERADDPAYEDAAHAPDLASLSTRHLPARALSTGDPRTVRDGAVPRVTRVVSAFTDGRPTARIPAAIESRTTARMPIVAAPRAPRVPARLPSVLDDEADRRRQIAARASGLARFVEAETDKPRALPRATTIIPVVSPRKAHRGTGLSRMLRDLEEPRFWPPRRQRRPLRHMLTSLCAMAIAVVAVLGLLVVSVPGARNSPNYASLTDSAGGQLGILYAAATQSTPGGQGLWQASASSVQVLGGGGASAPGATVSQTATAPAPTSPPATQPAAPPAAATATPQPAAPPAQAPAAKPQPTATTPPAPQPTAPPTGVLAAPVSPWPPTNPWMSVPGHGPYAVSDYAGDPYAAAFGQCTWWAQYERRDENLRGMGNARYWAANAAARGLRVGSAPQVGATVVFQPGVQGAGWAGHVAHVLALYPDGWFLVSEMNSYGNGGGWGRVSFRYVHTGAGVQFIY